MSLRSRLTRGVQQIRRLTDDASDAFNAVWRRSLQVRVVISTLALSAAVVVVLGLVLQTQIAFQVLQAKEGDTLNRADAARSLLERELAGVDLDREGAAGDLNKALDRLTTVSTSDEPTSPGAGEFRAALTTGPGPAAPGSPQARSRTCPASCGRPSRAAPSRASTSPSTTRARPSRRW